MSMNEKELPAINPSVFDTEEEEEEMGKDKHMIIHTTEHDSIRKLRIEIKHDINNLQTKIEKILNKRENDYLATFDEFMDTVRKDLKQKIEIMEKVEKEKRKNNDIKIITSERDFFRQEAIRLNELCKELSSKLDDMTRELKFQTSELVNLSKKWKESENTNKQLVVELERNIQINRELEFHLKVNQEAASNRPQNNNGNNPDANFEEDNYELYNKEKLIRMVEKLKFETKKEKNRNHKILAELNKVLVDQNKLEKIFIDCVEESRKEIFNRKLKESLTNKLHPNSSFSRTRNVPNINDVKYDNFLPSDKRKLLEIFIMKEEVINLIKDYVFKKIESGASLFDNKNSNTSLNNDLMQTKSSFMKTDKMFSMNSFRKKSPSTPFTLTMQIREKTPKLI